jgi:hypothetical protein
VGVTNLLVLVVVDLLGMVGPLLVAERQAQRFGGLPMDPFTLGALGELGRRLAQKVVENSTCAACGQVKWDVTHSWNCCRKDQCPSCAQRTRSRKQCSVCGSKVQ